MRRSGRRVVMMAVLSGALCVPGAHAQAAAGTAAGAAQGSDGQPPAQGGRRRGQYAGMGRVMGEITAVSGATFTVKVEDGSTVQVVTTDNTRLMKDRGPVKLADMHPGDGLMAVGNLDAGTKTLHAAMVFAEDAAQVKAMRENLGKTFITGRVTAVNLDDAKMTLERADHVAQTIGFDETTSFKRAVRNAGSGGSGGTGGSGGEGAEGGAGLNGERGAGGGGFGGGGMGAMAMGSGIDRAFNTGESITLADIKVGDYVAATGSVKAGTFVPLHLVDSPPGQRRQRNGTGTGQPGGAGAPPQSAPGAPSGPGER